MKLFFVILTILAASLPLAAQTNLPVRLALVSESDETANVADLLTAQFSGDPGIQLLERDQIAKVYREQSLSAGNADYLKLGQLLGADGLLLLETVKGDTNEFLSLRLVAVKPGVVLMAEQFPLPINDITAWIAIFTGHIRRLLPKLAVQPKDAIPLSVVNLRSADSSGGARELERELKILTIQRLSRESKFFVLERQQMDRLMSEKDLGTNDTPFWNGSYLLDGVVDQNGYSPNIVTLNVRLTPPGATQPLLLAVSGSRSNLMETVNELAVKVTEAVKVQSTAPAWDTADEARQYFDEANWAMRWGVNTEAQAAADSAWALGKHDAECAILRIRAYMVSPDAGKTVVYYPPTEAPDARVIANASHALELYNELSLNLPSDEPKVDSEWHQLGMDDLTTASRILQVYNWSPDFYEPVAEELAELRAAARATDAWMIRSPSVRDSYYVGDRLLVYDDLVHFQEQPGIFSLEVDCGCLWQETPEDSLALYRRLLASPVFRYLHDCFWYRESYHRFGLDMTPPRLVAWTRTDQKRIPAVWAGFLEELDASANPLWRLESKALQLADARENTAIGVAFTNFFDTFFASHDTLTTNNVDVLYLEWGTGDLVERTGGGIVYDSQDTLQHIYDTQYRPKIDAMGEEFRQNLSFLRRKEILKSSAPYDFGTFASAFADMSHCTKNQAVELKRLMEAYKSRLGDADLGYFNMTESSLDPIINAPVRPAVVTLLPASPERPRATPSRAPITAKAEVVTNAVMVDKFLPIPLDGLPGAPADGAIITAHHWLEGKLLLDFHYSTSVATTDAQGNLQSSRSMVGTGIAILDPVSGNYKVAAGPEEKLDTVNHYYDRSTLWHGDLYSSNDGETRKFNFQSQQWLKLAAGTGGNYELFNVNDHLYAADANIIFEISGDGNTTHILASGRRQPPASKLDTEDFGAPALFAGADHSLRVCVSGKIFTWTNDDWREDGSIPSGLTVTTLDSGLFLRNHAQFFDPSSLLYLPASEKIPQLLLASNPGGRPGMPSRAANPATAGAVEPQWASPGGINLAHVAASVRQSDLLLLVDHSAQQAVFDNQQNLVGRKYLAKNGYQARLLRYTPGQMEPQTIYLNFDDSKGCPPLTGQDPASMPIPVSPAISWVFAAGDFLFMGQEMGAIPLGAAQDPGGVPGIWVVRYSSLEPIFNAQIAGQLAGQRAAKADGQRQIQAENGRKAALIGESAEQFQEAFLAKYDRNHNGVLDPDEQAQAGRDPNYSRYLINEMRLRRQMELNTPVPGSP